MALNFTHGVVQWLAADAAGATYTVNLPAGFGLKALRFYWVGIASATDAVTETAHLRRGIGFATGTAARRCAGTYSADASASSDCGAVVRNDAIAATVTGSATTDGLLDITTFSAEQFVLTVDDAAPVDITVAWEAWGGDEITVATVGDIAEPAATGVQTYTVTGFTSGATDQVVMLAGINSTAAVNTAAMAASGLYAGFATGTGTANNIVVAGNADDAQATMRTNSYGRAGECLARTTNDLVAARAQLTQFNANNFGLNWLERANQNARSIFMAIKGGGWAAGSYTIDASTLNATATVSGLAFRPSGVSSFGHQRVEATADTAQVHDRMSFGSASSTTARQSMGLYDVDAAANSDINLTIQYDQLLSFPTSTGTLGGTFDLDAINADGFQVIVDATGGAANEWQGYLAFGSTLTRLYLRNTTTNGIGSTYYDMIPTAGASVDSAITASTAAGTEIQLTKTSGGALVNFVSGRAPVGGFTLTSVDVALWAWENSTATNVGGRLRLFQRTPGGTETEIGGGPFDDGVEFTTGFALYTWTANVTDTAIEEDNRIVAKLYLTNIGTMAVGDAIVAFNDAAGAFGGSYISIFPAVAFKAESAPAFSSTADTLAFASQSVTAIAGRASGAGAVAVGLTDAGAVAGRMAGADVVAALLQSAGAQAQRPQAADATLFALAGDGAVAVRLSAADVVALLLDANAAQAGAQAGVSASDSMTFLLNAATAVRGAAAGADALALGLSAVADAAQRLAVADAVAALLDAADATRAALAGADALALLLDANTVLPRAQAEVSASDSVAFLLAAVAAGRPGHASGAVVIVDSQRQVTIADPPRQIAIADPPRQITVESP